VRNHHNRSRQAPDKILAMLVACVVAAVPGIDEPTAETAVLAAAKSPNWRTMLLRDLEGHPGWATSGDSDLTNPAQRLVRFLHAAGASVTLPRCAQCARTVPLPRTPPSGGRLCATCGSYRDAKPCSKCGHQRPVVTRTESGGALCQRCYRRDAAPKAPCIRCGRVTWADRRTPEGPLCGSCSPRRQVRCHLCGTDDQNYRVGLLDGPVCSVCYLALRRAPTPCPSCHATKVLAFHDSRGQRICAACVGRPSPFACQQCGREDHYHGRRCAVCVVTERATRLVSDPDGNVHPRLRPVLDALLAAADPKTPLEWIRRRSAGPKTLHDMALSKIAISHEALDGLPPSHAVEYLRDLLVATGVLPAREPYLEGLTAWVDRFLTSRPAEQVRVLRPYTTWYVLRRTRAKTARSGDNANTTRGAREAVRQAAALMDWLHQHDKQLPALSQSDLDAWLDTSTSTRHRHLLSFLTWARARHLIGDVRIPKQIRSEPANAMADDQRWQTVHRLLHDDDLGVDLRVAALFILLYGQRASDVVTLTTDRVHNTDSTVTVRFGDDEVRLPSPLDNLVQALQHHRGHAAYASDSGSWLFPGGRPGRHITAEVLRCRLRQAGIPTIREARNAALMHLAAEVPAALLAGLIGISPRTAVAWATLAKQDWTTYTAARHERIARGTDT